MQRAPIAAAVAVFTLASGPSSAAQIPRQVIANGAQVSAGTGVNLRGTAGQPAVGLANGPGLSLHQGFWAVGSTVTIDVEPGALPSLPTEFAVGPVFPNPSRGEVRLSLSLPRAAEVRLDVTDVAGRRVGTPLQRSFEAGIHDLRWVSPGRRAGVFFVRLSVDRHPVRTRRFVLIH